MSQFSGDGVTTGTAIPVGPASVVANMNISPGNGAFMAYGIGAGYGHSVVKTYTTVMPFKGM